MSGAAPAPPLPFPPSPVVLTVMQYIRRTFVHAAASFCMTTVRKGSSGFTFPSPGAEREPREPSGRACPNSQM